MTKISLINLGCPKNIVDSENILGALKSVGMQVCSEIEDADIILLNTCAFIKEAKEESIDFILELAKLKKEDPHKKLVVVGCLVQRYLKELIKELPEVDVWVPLDQIQNIADILSDTKQKVASHRHRITPSHYTYIKISEGCSNRCSYCAIPNIRGPYRSRSLESILDEARQLTAKEINVVAQDTTNHPQITEILRELCKLDVQWIRLLYTHPAHIRDDLIREIARQDKICKYIDLPLQHIDDDILYKMNRQVNSSYIRSLIKKIRDQIPDVVIRTTFIVGFPGETEEKFKKLLDFMEEIKFERLGIFKYSKEEGTLAYNMPDQVHEKTKERRFHEAMTLQNRIAGEVNKKFMGRTMDILVEEPGLGRTYADAPEVDGVVYIHGDNLKVGDIIKARITDTLEYDLVAETIKDRP